MREKDGRVYANRFKVMPHYSVGFCREITGMSDLGNLPTENKSRGEVSNKASTRIRNAMNWLMFFSDRKWVWSVAHKKGYYFKLNFITLTLSSKQEHTDDYIVAHMLQPFLKWMGRKHNAYNYIWKAEIQPKRFKERGERCIHFHITTNKFIHYKAIRNKWNRLQVAHGYLRGDIDAPSTEIKSVKNEGEIIHYMAKYIMKQPGEDALKVTCKVWGCNHTLSTLGVTLKEESCTTFWNDTMKFAKEFTVKEVRKDYCVLLYNRFQKTSKLPGTISEGIAVAHDKFMNKDDGMIKYSVDEEKRMVIAHAKKSALKRKAVYYIPELFSPNPA